MNERIRLLNLLRTIEMKGDIDDGSRKHVLHGLTALYHRGSWEKAEDYLSPGRWVHINTVKPYWEEVAKIFNMMEKHMFAILVKPEYTCHYRMDLYDKNET